MLKLSWICCALAASGLAGCGDDNRPAVRGDAGGIMLMDSGPMPDGGSPVMMDAGGGGACPPQTVAPPTMPSCAATTLTCLMGAMTAMAQQACVMADPDPGCLGCINGELISCATMNGCAQQAGDAQCCGDNRCASASDPNACAQTMCMTELNALVDCVNGTVMSRTCGLSNLCFAPM